MRSAFNIRVEAEGAAPAGRGQRGLPHSHSTPAMAPQKDRLVAHRVRPGATIHLKASGATATVREDERLEVLPETVAAFRRNRDVLKQPQGPHAFLGGDLADSRRREEPRQANFSTPSMAEPPPQHAQLERLQQRLETLAEHLMVELKLQPAEQV